MANLKNQSGEGSEMKVSNFLYRQVSFWLSIGGLVFGAFIYLTAPSRDNDTALQLQAQQIAQQQKTIDSITKTQQNDTQEVKSNLKTLTDKIEQQSITITQLTTIINERIPARK